MPSPLSQLYLIGYNCGARVQVRWDCPGAGSTCAHPPPPLALSPLPSPLSPLPHLPPSPISLTHLPHPSRPHALQSNSFGAPFTGTNGYYAAPDVDTFLYQHNAMLILYAAGNFGGRYSTLPAPQGRRWHRGVDATSVCATLTEPEPSPCPNHALTKP